MSKCTATWQRRLAACRWHSCLRARGHSGQCACRCGVVARDCDRLVRS